MAALKKRLGRIDGRASVTLITCFIIQWMGATWSDMKSVNGIRGLEKSETSSRGAVSQSRETSLFSAEAGTHWSGSATVCSLF